MDYIKVKCVNQPSDIPILSIHELDKDRFELRKVELYSSGEVGYASKKSRTKTTDLSPLKIPSNENIENQKHFSVETTTKEYFENIWDFIVH